MALAYVGSDACKTCHARQFELHSKSGHARSLARSGERWAFGAGDQAITYVSRLNDEYHIEHGLTWFAAKKSLGLTPGHKDDRGERYRTLDPDAAILRCFQCHSTGPLSLDAGFGIVPSEPGVKCESCHGPGAEHVKSRAPMRNPGKMTAAALNEFCGACHRKPAAAGEDTDFANPWNARHQPLYLSRSTCFLQGKGALSCLTCHPAHQPVSRNRSHYDARCVSCHKASRHQTVAVAKRSCVGCHMPDVKPQPELRFSNHWIAVYR